LRDRRPAHVAAEALEPSAVVRWDGDLGVHVDAAALAHALVLAGACWVHDTQQWLARSIASEAVARGRCTAEGRERELLAERGSGRANQQVVRDCRGRRTGQRASADGSQGVAWRIAAGLTPECSSVREVGTAGMSDSVASWSQRLRLVLALGWLVACDGDTPACKPRETLPDQLLGCDAVPELCARTVISDIREADLAVAIDLVFVPDGFASDELGEFHERVDELVDEARMDPSGILGRDPALFNVHRVEVAASLGSCTREDPLDGSDFLDSDRDRVVRAAANAPAVDVVIVLSRNVDGRANAPINVPLAPLVHLGEDAAHEVLTHELGHALFGLGDEYVELDDAHPSAGLPRSLDRLRPNVSLSADESWDGLVAGAREGAQRYERGVYRPTDSCRMIDSESAFCPVCSAHIDGFLAARRAPGQSPMTCGLTYAPVTEFGEPCSTDEPGCVWGRVEVRAWDGDGIDEVRLVVDTQVYPELFTYLAQLARPTFLEQVVETSLEGASQLEVRCVDSTGEVTASVLEL